MKVLGTVGGLLMTWGLTWGLFDRKFLPLAFIGSAIIGLYVYGMKGAH